MKTITIQNFHEGMADDVFSQTVGGFSVAKHFDVLTYPNRLHPLRGMASDTASTKIGNIIVASDGLMYGVGEDGNNPGLGKLWQRSGYGASDGWGAIPTTNQLSGVGVVYPLLVEYVDVGTTPATDKTMFWAGTNKIVRSSKVGASSSATDSLSFTNIGQGLVHPKDKVLYIPYDNKIATYAQSTTLNSAQLTIPAQYQIPCLTYYGNYLAIPGFATQGGSVNQSIVYLWDRDTSLATLTESIPWGQGQLKVLNNLNGELIGISIGSSVYSGSVQDQDSIFIKGYNGGSDPVLIKELVAQHLPASSHPVVTINPNVNFVYKNRLYFSISIVPTDGVSNSYYGLWSIGKNKINGQYTVNLERMATNDNSETGVLAAAMSGDFVSMAHTAVGTLTCTINGITSSTSYGATSVYESLVNPGMSQRRDARLDIHLDKKLYTVACHYRPLTTGAQVVMKYRVDSSSSADWITIFTETTVGETATEMVVDASGNAFTSGRNYEFRIESTGGAEPIAFSYKFDILSTNL